METQATIVGGKEWVNEFQFAWLDFWTKKVSLQYASFLQQSLGKEKALCESQFNAQKRNIHHYFKEVEKIGIEFQNSFLVTTTTTYIRMEAK